MAVSKIIINGVTIIDVTNDTVDATNLLSGYTALKNDGTSITGTASGGPTVLVASATLSAESDTITFSNFNSLPSFCILINSTANTYSGLGQTLCLSYMSPNVSPNPASNWHIDSENKGKLKYETNSSVSIDSWGNQLVIQSQSRRFQPGTFILYYIL